MIYLLHTIIVRIKLDNTYGALSIVLSTWYTVIAQQILTVTATVFLLSR